MEAIDHEATKAAAQVGEGAPDGGIESLIVGERVRDYIRRRVRPPNAQAPRLLRLKVNGFLFRPIQVHLKARPLGDNTNVPYLRPGRGERIFFAPTIGFGYRQKRRHFGPDLVSVV